MTDHPRSGGTQSVAQPLPWSKLTGWVEAEPGFQQGMCNHPPMCLPKGCQRFCRAGSFQLSISTPRGAPAHGWPDSRKQQGLSAPQQGRGLRATCTTLLVGSPGHSTPRPACARFCPQRTQPSTRNRGWSKWGPRSSVWGGFAAIRQTRQQHGLYKRESAYLQREHGRPIAHVAADDMALDGEHPALALHAGQAVVARGTGGVTESGYPGRTLGLCYRVPLARAGAGFGRDARLL